MGVSVQMIVWLLDLQLPMQSVPTITNVVRSNTTHGQVYSIQHYVIKFVSDLRQIGGLLRFHPKKLKQPARHYKTEMF